MDSGYYNSFIDSPHHAPYYTARSPPHVLATTQEGTSFTIIHGRKSNKDRAKLKSGKSEPNADNSAQIRMASERTDELFHILGREMPCLQPATKRSASSRYYSKRCSKIGHNQGKGQRNYDRKHQHLNGGVLLSRDFVVPWCLTRKARPSVMGMMSVVVALLRLWGV